MRREKYRVRIDAGRPEGILSKSYEGNEGNLPAHFKSLRPPTQITNFCVDVRIPACLARGFITYIYIFKQTKKQIALIALIAQKPRKHWVL